jgi:hypothetical protein
MTAMMKAHIKLIFATLSGIVIAFVATEYLELTHWHVLPNF